MASSSTDALFSTLPRYLQRRIDHAFDAQTIDRSRRRDASSKLDTGGLIEDTLGGGFLVEDADTASNHDQRTEILMSSIPEALQHLDLPPDDEQVLAVFRNAAFGWTASTSDSIGDQDTGGGMVSRDDWRSVCAVLFENHQEDGEDDSGREFSPESDEDIAIRDRDQASEASNDDSDEDYVEDTGSLSSRRRTRGPPAKSTSSPHSTDPLPSQEDHKLTKRQQQAALQAFALFFPFVPASEVGHQKIMLKDIQRVAKLLGEKIKADEMVEMLDSFSSTPDKSIGFADFGRIMVAAQLA